MGVSLLRQRKPEDAISVNFERGRHQPEVGMAYNNIGVALATLVNLGTMQAGPIRQS